MSEWVMRPEPDTANLRRRKCMSSAGMRDFDGHKRSGLGLGQVDHSIIETAPQELEALGFQLLRLLA
jgi:hypothetical protein